ncbi:BTAD domain-containing putative transcriptional regulator [Actinacidiphila alni]|nr:BTAD domain-containing putative transcriptional regulator [Actinacidiphila alni]
MHFRLLGRLELATGDDVLALPGALSRAIVGRLLLARGAVVQRDVLVDELWEDREAKDPVNALQVQVAKLRQALAAQGEEDRLLFRHGGYQLPLRPQDDLDVIDFEAALRDGRRHLADGAHGEAERSLRRGLALWRGPALEDIDGRPFDAERVRLHDLRLSAEEDAATAGLELGRAEELVPELQALVARAPLRERARGRLMLALYRTGRQAEAMEVYEAGRRVLDAELGVAPSPELRALHASMLRHEVPQRPAPGGAPAADEARQDAPAGNLVRPLGAFIGRRDEIQALRAVVGRERLVTVLGTGGVGKTRLALETCAQARNSFDAVWWVDLSSVGDSGVLSAVAAALGLSDASVRPDQPPHDYVPRLTSLLGSRRSLLALDNCEHLLDAVAPVVSTLLGRCPSLTVLTTSRAPLDVPGEVVHPLAPMSDEEAGELFTARAVMVAPAFRADDEERRRINSLCRRLDGLPLAVELAAAHVRLLSVREIEQRLDDRFALLAKGDRTAPERHRTLRAVLDWSYALLDDTERGVLAELALYVGGCSLDVAENLGPVSDRGPRRLTVLAQLVDKSLLVPVTTPHGSRLRMLETVREYALSRLYADDRAAADAENRFMSWATDFVYEGFRGIGSGDQQGWLRQLTEESANVRAASDLMTARSRHADSLLLEARLGYYWFISGREDEGIERLRRTLRAYDDAAPRRTGEPSPQEEWALFYTFAWLAWLNHVAGRHAEASSYITRHRAAWHGAKNPDVAVLGPCYETLHAMLNGRQELEELFTVAEDAVAGTRFHWERAVLQTNWSTYCLQRGDVEGAREHGLVAVTASRAGADDFARAFSLMLCGDADEFAGLYDRARAQWDETADIFSSVGSRTRWAYTVLRLACLDIREWAHDTAELRLDEVGRLAEELSADDLHAAVLNLRAVLALRRDRPAEARTAFSTVWECATAPLDRRAVAAAGLAFLAAEPGADAWIGRARAAHDRLLEPLSRRAVGVLLKRLEQPAGDAGPRRTPALEEWLSSRPSVVAAFC